MASLRRRQLLAIPAQWTSTCAKAATCRSFHTGTRLRTDGVYAELTAMRVRTPWIEALRQWKDKGTETTKGSPAQTNRDVTPKRMSDSYHRVVLPLASDKWMLDNYLNANGHIRVGTLMMDLDALSGIIAYKHTGEAVTTVTAAVDRITIKHPLRELCDLELSGQVTFATGRSSIEISLQVAKAPAEGQAVKQEDVLMTCAFTMVSLDPATKRPVNVAPLEVFTPEEKRLFTAGERNYNAKKELSETNLRRTAPNDQESALIHKMWLNQLDFTDPSNAAEKPLNMTYMADTRLYNASIMQPQYRNRHHFMIFGGFLLKQTFELAFTCAAAFSHSRPIFISLDPSTFENPVPVGSVLYLTATVAYTDEVVEGAHDPIETIVGESGGNSRGGAGGSSTKKTRVQVRVDSKVRNVEHGETKPTGQFNYTFAVDKDIKVMPKTYSELMIWIDARRRAERVSRSLVEHEGRGGGRGGEERVIE